jgi:hypothetical protein
MYIYIYIYIYVCVYLHLRRSALRVARKRHITIKQVLHDHSFNLVVPKCCLVGDPLSGNGCSSPNQIVLVTSVYLFYLLNLFLI